MNVIAIKTIRLVRNVYEIHSQCTDITMNLYTNMKKNSIYRRRKQKKFRECLLSYCLLKLKFHSNDRNTSNTRMKISYSKLQTRSSLFKYLKRCVWSVAMYENKGQNIFSIFTYKANVLRDSEN